MTKEDEIYNEGLNPKNIRYRIPDRDLIPAEIEKDAMYWHNKVDKIKLNKDFLGNTGNRFSYSHLAQLSQENSLALFERER
jgi:hypothetical protein